MKESLAFEIVPLRALPPDQLAPLVADSEAAGYRFVRRLLDEWQSGQNRFDRPGEAFFAANWGTRCVGVCGLNIDPYGQDPRTGRVRHLYVLSEFRRRGVGRALVAAVVRHAAGSFDRLRLRTEEADAFYEALGFQRALGVESCTHLLELRYSTHA